MGKLRNNRTGKKGAAPAAPKKTSKKATAKKEEG